MALWKLLTALAVVAVVVVVVRGDEDDDQLYKPRCTVSSSGHETCAPPPASCRDLNVHCAAWAFEGECKEGNEWMQFNCALSCGHCPTAPSFARAVQRLNDVRSSDDATINDIVDVYVSASDNVTSLGLSHLNKVTWIKEALEAIDDVRIRVETESADPELYLMCVRLLGKWIMSGKVTGNINRATLEGLLDTDATYSLQSFSYAGVPELTTRIKYGVAIEVAEYVRTVLDEGVSNIDTGFGTAEATKRVTETAKSRNVPVMQFHEALPKELFDVLHEGFKPGARYWQDTHYLNSKRRGFYSWWYDYKNGFPQNAIEQVFDYLVKNYIPEEDRGRIIGGEMWAHARIPDLGGLNGHPCHYDHDEHWIDTHGTYRSPLWSSLFFVEAAGGPTIVTNISPQSQNADHAHAKLTQGRDSTVWLTFPERNKFVVFNGTKSHCVLADAQRDADQSKQRITMMFGFWADECSHASPQGPCAFMPRSSKQGMDVFELRKDAKMSYEVDVGVTPRFDWIDDFPVVNDDLFFQHQKFRATKLPRAASLPRGLTPGYTEEFTQFDFPMTERRSMA